MITDVTGTADAAFWAVADRHLVRYGGLFTPEIINRAAGSYPYTDSGHRLLDSRFPRYVWRDVHGICYEGRLVDRGLGQYKGYPLLQSERRDLYQQMGWT